MKVPLLWWCFEWEQLIGRNCAIGCSDSSFPQISLLLVDGAFASTCVWRHALKMHGRCSESDLLFQQPVNVILNCMKKIRKNWPFKNLCSKNHQQMQLPCGLLHPQLLLHPCHHWYPHIQQPLLSFYLQRGTQDCNPQPDTPPSSLGAPRPWTHFYIILNNILSPKLLTILSSVVPIKNLTTPNNYA